VPHVRRDGVHRMIEVFVTKAAYLRRVEELLGIGYTVAVSYETTNMGKAEFHVSYLGVKHGSVPPESPQNYSTLRGRIA